MCWDGPSLGSDTSSYLVNLSLEDISEIEVAMHTFKGRRFVASASQHIQLTHEQGWEWNPIC